MREEEVSGCFCQRFYRRLAVDHKLGMRLDTCAYMSMAYEQRYSKKDTVKGRLFTLCKTDRAVQGGSASLR